MTRRYKLFFIIMSVTSFPISDCSIVSKPSRHFSPSGLRSLLPYLVMMLKLLVFSVRPFWSPGPAATTRVGSHPSVTDTLNGLLGTGVSSYRTWTVCRPRHTHTHAKLISIYSTSVDKSFCLFQKEFVPALPFSKGVYSTP